MNYLLVFLVPAVLSAFLTPRLARLGTRAGIVDHPSERRVHVGAVPRLGGVSIALTMTLTLGACLTISRLTPSLPDASTLVPILVGAILVFAVGLWDDLQDVSPATKLLVQLVAALVATGSQAVIRQVMLFGTVYDLGAWGVPATLLWIVGLTNAFNLMDGLDGLAGGLVAIAATTCAIVLIARGETAGAMLLVTLVGAVAGFLPYNFNPATVFLGDSGSLLSGYLLAVTAIMGRQKGATVLAAGIPLLVFGLPIAETVISVARRLVTGQRQAGPSVTDRLRALAGPLRADREHLHHRLLAVGLSQRQVVLLLYACSLVLSVIALATMEVP